MYFNKHMAIIVILTDTESLIKVSAKTKVSSIVSSNSETESKTCWLLKNANITPALDKQ